MGPGSSCSWGSSPAFSCLHLDRGQARFRLGSRRRRSSPASPNRPSSNSPCPDGRIFVAEKSGLIKVFDNLNDPTPTVFADLRTKVHNFWDRGLLGMALHPSFPTDAVASTSSTPTTRRSAAPRLAGERPGRRRTAVRPRPARPLTAASSAAASRASRRPATDAGHGAGADRGLVPAVPEPLDRVARIRRGRRAVRVGRRRRELQLRRLRPGRQSAQPVRRPARWRRRDAHAADRGGRRAAEPGSPHVADPASLDGTILRVDPATGAALPDNPLAGSADANARRIVAYGLRNPFRLTVRPGTNELWIGDVGWNTWEEINRLADPTGAVENFGWPCYEGVGRQSGYDAANLNICENLYAAGAGAVTAPYFAYNHSAKVVANETCPTGSSSVAGLAFYHGRPVPGRLRRRALLRRLLARLHLGDVAGAGRAARPGDRDHVRRRRRRTRSTSRSARAATSSTSTSTAARSAGSTTSRPTSRRRRSPPPTRRTARRRSTVRLRRQRARATRRATRSRYAWDLDGDGAFDDATRRTPTFTYTQPGSYTARLRVTDAAAASPPTTVDLDHRRQHAADGDDRHADAAHDAGRSATSIAFTRTARPTRSRARFRPPRSLDARPAPLPVELPRARDPELDRRRGRRRSSRPTTSTRRTSSCGSRRPTPAACTDTKSVDLDPATVDL